jgi:hypothetical protein
MTKKLDFVIGLDTNFKKEVEKFQKKCEKNFELKKLNIENDFILRKENHIKKLDKNFDVHKKMIALKIEKKYQDLNEKLEKIDKRIDINKLVEKSIKSYI